MKLSLRAGIIAGVAIAIAFALFGWCQRREGQKVGAVNQELATNAGVVQDLRLKAVVVDKAADVETKKLVAKSSNYSAARTKIELKGDSIIADGQRVEMPSVAAALAKADTLSDQVAPTVVKQSENTAARDSLISSLDGRADLLQEAKRPRFGTKTGIAIGVVGTVTVVYIAVRIIKAVAHK